MNKRTHHPLTRRRLLRSLPAGALILHAAARGQQARRPDGSVRLLIGTSGRGSKGIYSASFLNGTLQQPELVAAAANPSFLCLPEPGSPLLFAVTQADDQHSSASSYRRMAMRDTPDESFPHVSDASSGSPGGCHVAATRDGTCVFVANYGGGSVASFHADAEGRLTLATLIAYPANGHGPDKDRQTQSYVHSAQAAPGEEFVLVSDLGLDRIHILRLDRATAKLTPHGQFLTRPGVGPRHLVAHSNGRWIYSMNELNSSIDLLDWDGTKGTLTLRTIFNTLPHHVDPVGKRGCEVVFGVGEKFLYAANRVYEDFAVFSVNPQTGMLSNIQHLANPGKEARHIAIDPTGNFLLTANQFSDDVTVFPIDPSTGKVGASTCSVKLGGPSCLVFG